MITYEEQDDAATEVPPGPFRFERRQQERRTMSAGATAFELAGEGFGRTHAMRTVDMSPAGLGAVSDTVITPGTWISVGFDAVGIPARRGVVARCRPCGNGYHIAVSFQGRLAA